jgi:hypothetical protein
VGELREDGVKMARGPQKQANTLFDESQGDAATARQHSNQLYDQLFPTYEGEVNNPTGFDPITKAGMKTSAMQTVGGATGGAVGQGDLMAARTRNSGGFEAAGDEAERIGQRQLSADNMGIDQEDAALKEQHHQQGIAGEQGLYSGNQSELLASMGLGNQAVNTELEAGKSGWLQNFMQILQTIGGLGTGAGAAMSGAAKLKGAGAAG